MEANAGTKSIGYPVSITQTLKLNQYKVGTSKLHTGIITTGCFLRSGMKNGLDVRKHILTDVCV